MTFDPSSFVAASWETVRVDTSLMPEPRSFAWAAWLGSLPYKEHLQELPGLYDLTVRELEETVSFSPDGLSWVWMSNGAGDFVRMSSCKFKDHRWMIAFNHESARSPWGANKDLKPHERLPEGFKWIEPFYLHQFFESDQRSYGRPYVPSMTEAYKSYTTFDGEREWLTSPVIAAGMDETNYLSYLEYCENPDDIVAEEMTETEVLYQRLMDEDYPSLAEIVDYVGDEFLAAIAFRNMGHIKQWLLPADD
jgi:hypothetical protein